MSEMCLSCGSAAEQRSAVGEVCDTHITQLCGLPWRGVACRPDAPFQYVDLGSPPLAASLSTTHASVATAFTMFPFCLFVFVYDECACAPLCARQLLLLFLPFHANTA